MKQVRILSVFADNEFGVLTRITALIRREGWNIKTLSVAETIHPSVSRLTIGVECIDSTLEMVLKRILRLDCVRRASICETCGREMALAHLPADAMAPEGSRMVGERVYEYTGLPGEVDAWCHAVAALGASDIARGGVVTLEG